MLITGGAGSNTAITKFLISFFSGYSTLVVSFLHNSHITVKFGPNLANIKLIIIHSIYYGGKHKSVAMTESSGLI